MSELVELAVEGGDFGFDFEGHFDGGGEGTGGGVSKLGDLPSELTTGESRDEGHESCY